MEHFREAPSHYSWKFMLKRGAQLDISIYGRWDQTDAAKVERLFGMILDIIRGGAIDSDDEPPKVAP